MRTLGIIGLGAMGKPIAERLLASDYRLYTYVRSSHSLERAGQMGIEVVPDPSMLSQYTDTVLLIVNNYSQCKDCLFGEKGVLSGMSKGTVVLLSTIHPDEVRELKGLFPDGVSLLSAPISGGVPRAEQGTLISLVSGNESDYLLCKEIFGAYSCRSFYLGEDIGAALNLKAINQMLVSIHMVAAAESMALAKELDIPSGVFLEAIGQCAGNSTIFQSRIPKLIAGDYSVRASLATLEKDTKICMDLAKSVDIPCYLTELCHGLFEKARASSPVEEDACAVIREYGKLHNESAD